MLDDVIVTRSGVGHRRHGAALDLRMVIVLALALLTPAAYAQPALDYRQREELKNADYYLRQVEGGLVSVTQQVDAAHAGNAQQAQAGIEQLRQRLGYANDRLDKLPADHADVKASVQRANAAATAIEELQARLDSRVSETADAVQSEAEQLAGDIDKLKSWGALFANPKHQFDYQLDDALAAAGHLEEVEAEVASIEGRWPRLFDQQNRERAARDLRAAKSYFDRSFPAFRQYVDQLTPALPDQMRAHLDQTAAMVKTAVAEKRHLYFTGGIPQQVEQAERTLRIFQALDAAGAQPFADDLASLEEDIVDAQRALRESIIQGNQPPTPNYAGSDVEDLRAIAREAWVERHPDDRILGIVFNTPGWTRVTRWQWSEGYKAWEKVDYSKIQPKIIIEHDARLATVYPIDIYKDHMKQDRVHATPWEKEEDPDVRMLVLLERVK